MIQSDDAIQWLQQERDRLQAEQIELRTEIRELTMKMAVSTHAVRDALYPQLATLGKRLHQTEMTRDYLPFDSLIDELSAQRQAA